MIYFTYILYGYVYIKMSSKDLIKEDKDFKDISMFNEMKFHIKFLELLNSSDCAKANYFIEKLLIEFFTTLSKEKQEMIKHIHKTIGSDYDISINNACRYEEKKEYDKAFCFYYLLAQKGHINAQNSLGYYYELGIGTAKDEKKAFECYKEIADKGDKTAQCNVGNCYTLGLGIEKNEKNAFEYFKKAADQDHSQSQYKVGLCYENGLGVEKNEKKAFEYFKKAADECYLNSDSQYKVGLCYENGLGVEVNIDMAIDYYMEAANNDHKDAKAKLNILSKQNRD